MAYAPNPADPQPHDRPHRPPSHDLTPRDPTPHTPQPRRVDTIPPAPRRAPDYEPPIPDTLSDADYHAAAWFAHVHAGRIGLRIPVSPEIAANRDRWTALARTMRT